MSVTVAKPPDSASAYAVPWTSPRQQAKKNGKIYAYGEIIHNMHEIERLEKLGVHTRMRWRTFRTVPACSFGRTVYRGMYTRCFNQKSAKSLMQPALLCGKYTK